VVGGRMRKGHEEERRVSRDKMGCKTKATQFGLKGRTCVCACTLMSCISVPACAQVDACMIYTVDTATPAEER